MVTPAFRMRGREPNFLRLEFLNGTPCDLDAVNRSAVVELYCGTKFVASVNATCNEVFSCYRCVMRLPSIRVLLIITHSRNRLVGIWEDSTCHYHVQVELSVLCTFTDFMPYKENVSAFYVQLPFSHTHI